MKATGLITTGITAAIGTIAPWRGFTYHEATLKHLTDNTASPNIVLTMPPQNFQQSLDSLVNVVLDNRLTLDYPPAGKGVCTVINKTCCIYINSSSEGEDKKQKQNNYDQVSWLHHFGKGNPLPAYSRRLLLGLYPSLIP